MNPKNVIALLTDFGTKDYFVGAMKGAILSIDENAKIIDITHEIARQDTHSAGFTLRACYRDFPEKTIFVTVVDPGVGSNRRAILVESDDYYFIAPDNGLLSFIFNEGESRNLNRDAPVFIRVFELTSEKYFAKKVSRTFHGRDIFAPVAAHLANGVAPEEFGREIVDFARFEETRPRKISDREIEAEIIHIDCFGNLITNLRRANLPEKFILELGERKIERLREFFAEAAKGEIFMIFGSAEFLEIAAREASAESILNARVGQKIIMKTL